MHERDSHIWVWVWLHKRKIWTQYNTKLCYTDTDSFSFYVKYENAYVDYVEDVETSFNASNYEVERYPRVKTKKSNRTNDVSGGKQWNKL